MQVYTLFLDFISEPNRGKIHCATRERETGDKAQAIAAHESPQTKKLYDRTSNVTSLDKIEKDHDLGKLQPSLPVSTVAGSPTRRTSTS